VAILEVCMTVSAEPTEPTEQPIHPVPTCCACILHQGRLLLIQRGHEPSQGLWSFPGGRIELGETLIQAVIREVREETGVEIEPGQVFQVYDHIVRDGAGCVRFHYVVNYLRSRYLSGEPRAGSDAQQVCWATEVDLLGLPMHPFARRTALRLLREATPGPICDPATGLTGIDPSSG
jgi:8-oxo-dGTP diphosphatase